MMRYVKEYSTGERVLSVSHALKILYGDEMRNPYEDAGYIHWLYGFAAAPVRMWIEEAMQKPESNVIGEFERKWILWESFFR